MPDQSIIVWDLETVPDLAAAARMVDLPNASEADVRLTIDSGAAQLKINARPAYFQAVAKALEAVVTEPTLNDVQYIVNTVLGAAATRDLLVTRALGDLNDDDFERDFSRRL